MEEIYKQIQDKASEFIKQKEQVLVKEEELKRAVDLEETKKQYLERIPDKKSGFYNDAIKELEEVSASRIQIYADFDVARKQLKNEINLFKESIINQIREKQSFIDENRHYFEEEEFNFEGNESIIKSLEKEIEELEKEIALNDTSRDDFDKLSLEDKAHVRKAKENVLNNMHKLNDKQEELSLRKAKQNKKDSINKLLDGKKPIDKFSELEDLISTIENCSNIENIERLDSIKGVKAIARREAEERLNADWDAAIKENKEFDRRKAEERLNADWDAAIKENEEFDRRKAEERLNADWDAAIKENEEFNRRKAEELLKNNNGEIDLNAIEENLRSYVEELLKQNAGTLDITKISINEKTKKVYISNGERGQKEYEISDFLKKENKKEIFDEEKIEDKCFEIAGNSKIKSFFLKRKVNPIIVATLSTKENAEENITRYIRGIYRKTNLDLNVDVEYKLGNSDLSLREKNLMKRYAGVDKKVLNADVIKDKEKTKLLNKSKRKIKNTPTTPEKGFKAISSKLKENTEKARIKISKLLVKGMNKSIRTTESLRDRIQVKVDGLPSKNMSSEKSGEIEMEDERTEEDENTI